MDEERLRFGDFELRPASGELRQSGTPVKIQPQPAKVLELLARRSGEVVSREDFRRHLWGEETFVDFEHGLNFSIRQIRRALGDSAETPRFVETVPRHGYRFLLPVTVETAAPAPAAAAPSPPPQARWRWMLGTAAAVVLLLILGLVEAERAVSPKRVSSFQAVSREAREAYLEGRHLTRREATREELEKGVAALQRAALLAPGFADAHARLAEAELRLGHSADQLRVAETAAHRAVDLDPAQARAHLALALIAFLRLDLPRAQAESDRALAADPKLAEAYVVRAHSRAAQGLHEGAIADAERVRELDPEGHAMEPDLLCYFFLLGRRYDDTVRCGQHIAEALPAGSRDIPWARVWAFWGASLAGHPDTAIHFANAAAGPSPRRLETLRDVWQWDLARLPDDLQYSADRAVDLYFLGERDRALDALEQTVKRADSWAIPFLGVDPRFDALRGDPRFEKLLQRLHLPSVNPSPRPGV